MKVRISKWGNSAAVRLPQSILKSIGLGPGDEVDISIEGRELRLTPKTPIPYYRIEDLVAEMKRLGPENAPPFEDWSAAEPEWPAYEPEDDPKSVK